MQDLQSTRRQMGRTEVPIHGTRPIPTGGTRTRGPWTKIAGFLKLMFDGAYRPSAPYMFLSLDGPGTDPDPSYLQSRGEQGALWVLSLYLEDITEFLSERENQ